MTQSPLPAPAPSEKLSLSTKLAFGAGDMGAGLTTNLVVFSFLAFLTNVAGLTPGMASTVVLIGKIWDGINDPMIGVLSDRTQSRWGRRHAWMLYGSIPFGISFALLWLVPDFGDSIWLKFGYYTLVSLLFFTAYTAINLPYAALTPELTQDYDERTTLSSFRLAFSLGGAVLGLVLGLVITTVIAGPERQYATLGVVCAIIAVLPLYWCIWGTRDRVMQRERMRIATHTDGEDQRPAQPSLPIQQQFKIVFSNRPFLYVIGIYLMSWLALQITAANIPYFVVSWMGQNTFFLVALAVQGAAIPMLFVCSALSQRIGKRGLYFVGTGFWILIQMGLLALQPGQTALMYVLALGASFGVATAYVVPWSMLPDVIELDELQTGVRREGIFYSFMTLLQKIGFAVGIFFVGQALEWAGFISAGPGEPPPPQPESALFAIRLVIGPLPAFCLLIGIVLAYFYPITREIHAEILLKLQERQQQRNGGDAPVED
ncbi:MAG: MFS transporter [Synechococcales bacterium]|nr:MFS transporter [Synechococcales bacterium]